MHIWNQHDKLHFSCNLHQNRTNLTQFRKCTQKVKKLKLKKTKFQKKKIIFGISVKNCTIDVIFIKIGLRVWKEDDPILDFFSVNISFAATVHELVTVWNT